MAWRDRTRELTFEPLGFLERVATTTPRPETNLLMCHGGLAPHAPWRARVVDVRPRGARAHGLGAAAGRRPGRQWREEQSAHLDMGGPDAPRGKILAHVGRARLAVVARHGHHDEIATPHDDQP